ncbi:MAG: tetratricopeptide repeat protein [Planctomycetota bacterium]|jgi:tetratricopeptide (TPR) repeat protein
MDKRWIGLIWGLVSLCGLLCTAAWGDTLHLKDGRFFTFPKITEEQEGYTIPYANGKVFVPKSMVLEAVIFSTAGGYKPKNEGEKKKVEKGLVPFEGKWIPKEKVDKILKARAEEAKKRIEELKKHMLWRNRYIDRTPHFVFEYTIAPAIAQNFQALLEAYYKVFAKRFKVRQTKATGGRLKVCFYHDDEYYYQVSGAPRGAIGYFRFVQPIELNFFYDRTDTYLTMCVLFHECNHYLVHLINPKFHYPAWLAEGMAEYYGASEWNAEKKELTTGLIQEGRTVVLKDAIDGKEWLGLEEMIKIDRFGAIHYAWGWSFVHMMMEDKKYAKLFLRYFLDLALSPKVKRADFAFGMTTVAPGEQIKLFKTYMRVRDLKILEKKWHAYVKDELKVQSGRGYSLAGNWAIRWGLKHRAIRYFKTAIEKGDHSAITYDKLGSLLMDKDKEDEAIDALKKAVEIAPLTARYYMHLGNALYDKGGDDNRKEGKRLMRLALEIDPEDTYLRLEARFKDLRKE